MPLDQQNIALVLMALIGCIGYIASQAACIIFAFDRDGRVNAKALLVTALCIVISLVMLIVGLWLV
ncbi:MAG: hypothetical protein GDYSWBUE_001884 [Candidatus Fervidibacterota bacterium]